MPFPTTYLSLAVCLAAVSAMADNAVSVDCAYFRQDMGRRYAWHEGAAALAKFAHEDRRAGILRVYLHNSGTRATPAVVVDVDRVAPDKLRDAKAHRVVWWRVWPNPVPPGGCAEVSVRLRTPPVDSVYLRLRLGDTVRKITIPPRDPGLRIGTVAWRADPGSPENTEVTLVAVKTVQSAMTLRRIFFDGRDMTAACRIGAPEFFHGMCPVVLRIGHSLPSGSFHTYRVETGAGISAACTLRTLPDSVRLGMYGAGDLERDVMALRDGLFMVRAVPKHTHCSANAGQHPTKEPSRR